ncbi:hypothetical protein KAJ61_00210 [Candidatus Parcubacteria bacterium]|nr:hypothetical protein [Candidatus Parcubacteria bacterium]
MKSIKIILIIGLVIAFFIALLFFFGRGMHEESPNLHDSNWKSISVEYLTGENKSEKQIWSTNNQAVLNQLQASFNVIESGDLWGYGTMTSNKIKLELSNGLKYELHLTSETEIVLNDYENLETGFGLDVAQDFYNTLKTVIESAKKESVYFY